MARKSDRKQPSLKLVHLHRPPTEVEVTNFNEWWCCWTIAGTRRSKIAAQRWYMLALARAGVDHPTLCAGVRRYMIYCEANAIAPRFIKHPPTWLQKGCWDDDYPEFASWPPYV